jgi:hypothetical protein
MSEEKKMLKFGEWYEANRSFHTTMVEYIAMPSSYGSGVQLEKRMMEVITPQNLLAILRAYDKHLDDHFNL